MGRNPQIVASKKHGPPEIVVFLPAAHNRLRSLLRLQLQVFPGGQSGLPSALACGMVTHIASIAAANISNVFFTLKLLVEVGFSA